MSAVRRSKGARLEAQIGRRVAESIGATTREVKIAAPEAAPARVRIRQDNRTFSVPVDAIGADPHQPRRSFDEAKLAELAESLKRSGQLQPCAVRPGAEPGRYVIVMGERRWRAAKLAGLPELLCRVVEGKPHAEALADQIAENVQRDDLNPVDLSEALGRLQELHGWSTRQIAERLGMSQSAVARALALRKLPDVTRELVRDGTIAPSTAATLARLDDPEEQEQVAKLAADGATRDQVERVVDRRLSHGDSPEPPAAPDGLVAPGDDQAAPGAELSHRDSGAEARPKRAPEARGFVWGCDLPDGATVSVSLPPGASRSRLVSALRDAQYHRDAEDTGLAGRWPIGTEVLVEKPGDKMHGFRGEVVGYGSTTIDVRLKTNGGSIDRRLPSTEIRKAPRPKGESGRAKPWHH